MFIKTLPIKTLTDYHHENHNRHSTLNFVNASRSSRGVSHCNDYVDVTEDDDYYRYTEAKNE